MDKILTYENLIQGFSRTNRIFGPDKPFGIIRYYRKTNTMKKNIDDAVELYAEGNPLELFVQKLEHNLNGMNAHFIDIEYMFNQAGIANFASLPDDRAVRQRFAQKWRGLNAHLEAAKLQGFVWNRKRYYFEPDENNPRRRSVTLKFDEHTYDTLAQRYRELFTERGGGDGGDDDVPYDGRAWSETLQVCQSGYGGVQGCTLYVASVQDCAEQAGIQELLGRYRSTGLFAGCL